MKLALVLLAALAGACGVSALDAPCAPECSAPAHASCATDAACGPADHCAAGACVSCDGVSCASPPANCGYAASETDHCCGGIVCAQCGTDADCDADQQCAAGRCRTCDGTECVTPPVDCEYESTVADHCCGELDCVGCHADTDCAADKYCSEELCLACATVTCAVPPPGCVYQPTVADHCCGALVDAPAGSCATDDDCAPGTACVSGECLPCAGAATSCGGCPAPPDGCHYQRDPTDSCACGAVICHHCDDDCDCLPQLACVSGQCVSGVRTNNGC